MDAAAPDVDQTTIQKFLKTREACFSDARGLQCKQGHYFRYMHTDDPVPFRAYCRPPSARPPATVEDFDENLLYAIDALTIGADLDVAATEGASETHA